MEIDPAILKIATEHFDLTQGEHLKVEIADGMEYLKNSAVQGKKYDAILFDVDSKDTSVGMSCPPKQFVEPDFLETVKTCLSDGGFFILNLVARNEKLREETIDDLKRIYAFVVSYKVLEDVNEVVFCSANEMNFNVWKSSVQECARGLNEQARAKDPAEEELFEVSTLLNNLKLEN